MIKTPLKLRAIELFRFMLVFLYFINNAVQATDINCQSGEKKKYEELICDYAILNSQYEKISSQQEKLLSTGKITENVLNSWREKRNSCHEIRCMDAVFAEWIDLSTSISEQINTSPTPESKRYIDTTVSPVTHSPADAIPEISRNLNSNNATIETATTEPETSPENTATTPRTVPSQGNDSVKLDPQSQTPPNANVEQLQGKSNSTANAVFWQGILLLWFILVILGVFAGWAEKITVFRNYDDLALVFFCGGSLVAAFFFMLMFGGKDSSLFGIGAAMISLLVGGGLAIYSIIRTWKDNPSLIRFPLALITKLTLAGLFLINLIDLLSPSGKTQTQRAKSRASALAFLVILTPIIFRLVRDKEGTFAPKHIFNRYQRGRLHL